MNASLKEWIYTHIYPSLGAAAIRIYSRTLRLRIEGGEEIERLRSQGTRIVYALMHGRQFMVYRLFGRKNICVMSSLSQDGRLQAAILQRFGFRISFGSSAKSPVRALIGMVKYMQEGSDSIIAVDGPRGPLYRVKPGVLFLAKKLNAVIVPFTFSVRRGLVMKAWDRYLLPAPFTKVFAFLGSPVRLSRDDSHDVMEKEAARLERILLDQLTRADELAGRPWNREQDQKAES